MVLKLSIFKLKRSKVAQRWKIAAKVKELEESLEKLKGQMDEARELFRHFQSVSTSPVGPEFANWKNALPLRTEFGRSFLWGEKSSRRSCEAGCGQQQDHRRNGKFPVSTWKVTWCDAGPKLQHSIPLYPLSLGTLVWGDENCLTGLQRIGFGDWCSFTYRGQTMALHARPSDSSHVLQVPGVAFTFQVSFQQSACICYLYKLCTDV